LAVLLASADIFRYTALLVEFGMPEMWRSEFDVCAFNYAFNPGAEVALEDAVDWLARIAGTDGVGVFDEVVVVVGGAIGVLAARAVVRLHYRLCSGCVQVLLTSKSSNTAINSCIGI
jgi:hypothetical protein